MTDRAALLARLQAERETLTLAAYIAAYFEYRHDLKIWTKTAYAIQGVRLVKFFGKTRLLSSITRENIEAWLDQWPRKTAQAYREQAKHFFSFAVKNGIISSNPFDAVGLTMNQAVPYTGRSRKYLTSRYRAGTLPAIDLIDRGEGSIPIFSTEVLDEHKKVADADEKTDGVEKKEQLPRGHYLTDKGKAYDAKAASKKAKIPLKIVRGAIKAGKLASFSWKTRGGNNVTVVLTSSLASFKAKHDKELADGKALRDSGLQTQTEIAGLLGIKFERDPKKRDPRWNDLLACFDCWVEIKKLTPHPAMLEIKSGRWGSYQRRIDLYDTAEFLALWNGSLVAEAVGIIKKMFRGQDRVPVKELSDALFSIGVVGKRRQDAFNATGVVKKYSSYERGTAAQSLSSRRHSKRGACRTWLEKLLKKAGGYMTAQAMFEAAKKTTFGERTIRNNAKRLKIRTVFLGRGRSPIWVLEDAKSPVTDALVWLSDYMESQSQEKRKGSIIRAAALEAGCLKGSLVRARKALGLRLERTGFADEGDHFWLKNGEQVEKGIRNKCPWKGKARPPRGSKNVAKPTLETATDKRKAQKGGRPSAWRRNGYWLACYRGEHDCKEKSYAAIVKHWSQLPAARRQEIDPGYSARLDDASTAQDTVKKGVEAAIARAKKTARAQ